MLFSFKNFQFLLANDIVDYQLHFDLVWWRHFLQGDCKSGAPRCHVVIIFGFDRFNLHIILTNLQRVEWFARSAFAWIYRAAMIRRIWRCWFIRCDRPRRSFIRILQRMIFKIHVGRRLRIMQALLINQCPLKSASGLFFHIDVSVVSFEVSIIVSFAIERLLTLSAWKVRFLQTVLSIRMLFQWLWASENFTAIFANEVIQAFPNCPGRKNARYKLAIEQFLRSHNQLITEWSFWCNFSAFCAENNDNTIK